MSQLPEILEIPTSEIVLEIEGDQYPHVVLATLPTNAYATPINVSWNDISDKPNSFPPAPHNHPSSQITDLSPAIQNILDTISTDGGYF